MGATTGSSPFSSQRVPTPMAMTVSTSFSTFQTRRMISSVRVDRDLDLDDGGHQLLVHDVFADRAGGDVRHEGGDWVFLFEADAGLGERPAHLLDVAEPDADAGAAELDGEADFADLDATADVVGLDLLGAAALDAGGFVRHARVGEGAADDAGPDELFGLERGRGTDVGLGVEAEAQELEDLAHGPDEGRVQVLLAEAVVAGVALDAFVAG